MARKVDKPRKIWDNYQEIGEVMKTARIKFVFAAATRDGIRYINIREFYYHKANDEWKASRGGLNIPMKYPVRTPENEMVFQDVFEAFIKQLLAGLDILTTMPIHDKEKEVWYYPQEKEEVTDNDRKDSEGN